MDEEGTIRITNKQVCFLCGDENVEHVHKKSAICGTCQYKLKSLFAKSVDDFEPSPNLFDLNVTTVSGKLRAFHTLLLPHNFRVQINQTAPVFTITQTDNHTVVLILDVNNCHVCGNQLNDAEDCLIHGYPICDDCLAELSNHRNM